MAKCLDLKFCVPSKNFELSKKFYEEIGFAKNWEAPALAEYQVGNFRFLLQDFYVEEHSRNFVVHMLVDDAQGWFDKIKSSVNLESFPGATLCAPEKQPWGLFTAFLIDPSGVLWHIAQEQAG